MKNFLDIGIPAELNGVLDRLNIVNPTEIQELSIPSALRGDDILASAQTGTGKTLSFALPIVMSLKTNANKRALILSPTRELATQIMKSILSLVDERDKSKAVLLIGGEPKTRQEKETARSINRTGTEVEKVSIRFSIVCLRRCISSVIINELGRLLKRGPVPDGGELHEPAANGPHPGPAARGA